MNTCDIRYHPFQHSDLLRHCFSAYKFTLSFVKSIVCSVEAEYCYFSCLFYNRSILVENA